MSTAERRTYDVVIASDFRFPGGTSASIAQEIRAQAAAGYTTALVQTSVSLLKRPRPINAKIQRCVVEGLADLVLADEPLHARILIMRHPVSFAEMPAVRPDVTADHKVMVVNQAPFDETQAEPFYDVPTVAANVERLFGAGTVWTPIGPIVRDNLLAVGRGIDILDWDWHNILDPEEWATDRTEFSSDRPVIGRHSRPHYRKWPETLEQILAAYPDDPGIEVKILGGAEVPQRVLGRLPDNWSVLEFNEVPAVNFLQSLDFFVYFHHPGLNEAFGRAMLEALATGAVVILPHHFERLFGGSCLYGEPADVVPIVKRLYANPEAYRAQSRRGVEWVKDSFSHKTHARRISTFVGEPDKPAPRKAIRTAPKPRAMFITSNGGGLGHLTRMMAMARRASDDIQPMFFTLSQSYGLVAEQGFPVEFCPSRDYSELSREGWSILFERRLHSVLKTYQPEVVIFDGTNPYPGLGVAHEQHSEIPFVWSRRGMWRPGLGADNLARAHFFDLVIEPSDFCDEVDVGATATARDPIPVEKVAPITLLDPGELVDREAAAAALGVDPERPTVLVDLADPDPERMAIALDHIIERLADRPGTQIVSPKSLTTTRANLSNAEVVTPSVYPLSRYFAAFDFAVSATGYNTFHELVRFGVPTIFIPKPETSLDDQDARARYAEQVGVGLCVERFSPGAFDAALEKILVPGARDSMRSKAADLCPDNGAGAAMRLLEDIARRGRPAAHTPVPAPQES